MLLDSIFHVPVLGVLEDHDQLVGESLVGVLDGDYEGVLEGLQDLGLSEELDDNIVLVR